MIVGIGVIFCLLVSGVFSGLEAGILSVNRARLRYQAKLREKNAVKIVRLLAHPGRLLATVLLVTNLMNICAIAVSTRALAHRFGEWGYAFAFAGWLPVYLGVELLPKSVFRRFPYRTLVPFAEMLRIVYWLLSPVLSLGSAAYDFLASKQHGVKQVLAAREDFKHLISENEKSGALSRIERQMIDKVVDFHGVTARDVMSPVSGVPTVRTNATIAELLAISRNSHHDRFPVFTPEGEVAGLVNIFDVLLDRKSDAETVGSHARRIVTIPPDEPAYSIIRKLRAARSSLAVVIDKNAAAAGIVSSEMLVKRLFGTAG
ncbi:MAG TPA: CNNM domain-containing protein [Chthoniobacteraceae bacterium]|nr:CNNM domain-containing protein [Chthoniobacteraceae bacterium]